MATIESVTSVTFPAGADLRTHQFKFVSLNSSGQVVLTADDARAQGVLMNDPNTGEAAHVAISGRVKVKCGANIIAGARVASGANGAAKTVDTNAVDLGIAIEAGAAGRIISILLGR